MKLNTDLALRVVVDSTKLPWIDTPEPGVQRRLLARDGYEVAQATTIVRYAPGSRFARHVHDLGEEILVLAGEFADELGSYPAGTYIKNPAGSSHSPHVPLGCTMFVKLRHLDVNDQERIVVRPQDARWRPGQGQGLTVLPLSAFGTQSTGLVRWAPDTRLDSLQTFGGEEILVLDGAIEDERGRYSSGTWIRSPRTEHFQPCSSEGGTVLVKMGHLASNGPALSLQRRQC